MLLRWVLRLLGLLILAVPVFARLLPSTELPPAYEETTISDYRADFALDDDGDLRVVERLSVDFPYYGKHGIFRFFDTHDPNDVHARRVPSDLTVTRDGAAEPMEVSRQEHGRYVVARIGSADVTLTPGTHVYELRYTVEGVLLDGPGEDLSTFYWNLIPGGWQQPIERAELTVDLPADPANVRCAVGVGATTGCEVTGSGSDGLVVRTGRLAPRTPVTLSTDLELPTPPAGNRLPWPAAWDPVLGHRLWLTVLLGVLALLGAVIGWWLSRGTREPQPPYPLQYAPPDGVGPAQAAFVLTEKTEKEAFVASLMYAAERGAVTLERGADSWTITDARGPDGWAGIDPVTAEIAGLIPGPGQAFVAERDSVAAGKVMQTQLQDQQQATRSWARSQGLIVPSGLGGAGALVVVAAVVLAGYLAFWDPLSMSASVLVPGLFAVFGVELVPQQAWTRRTAAGRDLWSRLGGFRRVLSTPSSVERFGFSGREELYTAYLPWAVVFGCAEAWAAKFRTEMGTEPPVPAYFGGYAGSAGGYADAMVADFSSTLSSAISSYEATQRSSSSGGGGGGFSGGGGGGGGGGGSW